MRNGRKNAAGFKSNYHLSRWTDAIISHCLFRSSCLSRSYAMSTSCFIYRSVEFRWKIMRRSVSRSAVRTYGGS